MKKIKIAIDVDDVVAECNKTAIKWLNSEKGTSYSIYDIRSWGVDNLTSERFKYFSDRSFICALPVVQGAQEFVKTLTDRGIDVIFCTAVPFSLQNERIEWIKKYFPQIPDSNIIIMSRKDLLNVDIMLDDAPHNILNSGAKYPILFRQPWNQDITGMLSVNNFDEALNLIEVIINQRYPAIHTNPDIFCLVAPSGSGKTEVCEILKQKYGFNIPNIYTTSLKKSEYYINVSRESFIAMNSEFAEITTYSGDYYGIRKQDIDALLPGNVALPVDICGVNALRRVYGSRVKSVFIKKDKSELIANIMNKNELTEKCKVLRIISLDAEEKNAEFCDEFIDIPDNNTIAEMIAAMASDPADKSEPTPVPNAEPSKSTDEAYQRGAKPISRWMKCDIINRISEKYPDLAVKLDKLHFGVLKKNLLVYTSSCKTGKKYAKTDFYDINWDKVAKLDGKDIDELMTDNAPVRVVKKYKGEIEYLTVEGEHGHKYVKNRMTNVFIEENGKHYIVRDKYGNELLRKKIDSRGTYVVNYEEDEDVINETKKSKAAYDRWLFDVRANSSPAAMSFYDAHNGVFERSKSGNLYPRGRMPSKGDYSIGISHFFEVGEHRLCYDNKKRKYILQAWSGKDWVSEDNIPGASAAVVGR